MNPRAISFHYTLTGPDGQTLDSSTDRPPLTFIEGKNQIIPGLETELSKMQVGETKRVLLKADAAYGPHNAELVFDVPRDRFPSPEVKLGDRFRSAQSPIPLTVTKLTDTHVTLDANHPLAGMDLTFDVDVTDIREATEEELSDCGHNCCDDHSHGCCGEEHKH